MKYFCAWLVFRIGELAVRRADVVLGFRQLLPGGLGRAVNLKLQK